MSSNRQILPYLALTIGIIALGFSALFVRWADAPGPVMGLYRMGLSTLILTPSFVIHRSGKGRHPIRKYLLFPILGGLWLASDLALWNTSIGYTNAANATLLSNTAPLWVALTAWLVFREKLNRRFWIGMVFSLIGTAIILGGDFFINPSLGWGDLLATGAGVFYAGYLLTTQKGREKMNTLSYIWWMGLSSAFALLILSLVMGMPIFGYPIKTNLAFLGSAIVTQVIGYLAMGYALGHLPASIVSPTLLGQPVITAVLAVPFLGELPHTTQWIGGVSVLLGIYLVHQSKSN